ncbi:hypothetical protein LPJ61_001219, partial [Coemansia biformis]
RLKSIAGLLDVGDVQSVPLDARTMTADKAAGYCFSADMDGATWGADDARLALLARGCVPDAVDAAWVQNHFRWVVWSSASLARRLPARWHEFWSAERVLGLLRHRYEREYELGERSALRRVLEADAAPQRLIVLCVASIAGSGADTRVEVTDGWYSIQAQVDAVLAQAIGRGRLRAGDKIACAGLSARGIADGVEPLSAESRGATLLLSANCVRRACWDAKLGFQRRRAMVMALSAVHRQGGVVGATLDVLVMRRYPRRFMEYTADGQRIVRSEKEEERVALAFAEARAARMQELLEERQARRDTAGTSGAGDRTAESTCNDDEAAAVLEVVEQEQPQRQVHPLLRMLVCDYPARPYRDPGASEGTLAVVTVWRPGPIEPADLAEGSRVLIAGAAVSTYCRSAPAAAGASLSLSVRPAAGSLRPAAVDMQVVARSRYRQRTTLRIDELQRAAACQEVDVVGETESCCAGAGGQMSVLRLRSTDRGGAVCFADVEFPRSLFGSISPAAGALVTVRNCQYTSPMHGGDTAVPRLFAGDVADFVL